MTGYFSKYIESILIIGLLAFLCESFTTSEKSPKSHEKALFFITSICILLTVISPFFDGLSSLSKDLNTRLDTSSNYNSSADENTFLNLTRDELEKQFLNSIYQKTGIAPTNVRIDLNVSDKEMDIGCIEIELDKKDMSKAGVIKEHILEISGNVSVNIYEDKNQ